MIAYETSRPASRSPLSLGDPGRRVLDAALRLPAPVPGALRQALHGQAAGLAAVRDADRPGRGQGGLHRAARRAAAGRGGARARARRRHQLGHPARRRRAHGAAQADAAGLPRRADGAARRADGGGRRPKSWPGWPRDDGGRAASADAGAHPGDHPARRLRPRPRGPLRRDPGATEGDARVRRPADQPVAAAEGQRRGARPRTGRAVRALRPRPGRSRRTDLRADRGAPRRATPSATTCWRCCSRPGTRTARR